MTSSPFLRKVFGLCAGLFALSGCSSDASKASLYRSLSPFNRAAPALAPEFSAAYETDAPALVAASESNPDVNAVFIRQAHSEVSGVETWISPDGVQIMLDQGFLVGTRGFGSDVLASDVVDSKALVRSFGTGYVTRLMTLIDGENHAVTRAFRCRIEPGEQQSVNQGKYDVMTRTVTETCRSKGLTYHNFYWVVPASGEIIQSSQWAGLSTDKVSLRLAPRDNRS